MNWTELSPDFSKTAPDELFKGQSLLAMLAVLESSIEGPTVLFEKKIWTGIKHHLESENVELGGLLLGYVFENLWVDENPVVLVTGFTPSEEYQATGVSLYMQSDVWERARRSESGSVVGWYHSHPNLGAFFTGTDRRTQKDFFREAHCIALVYDPIRFEEKWFIGPNSTELCAAQIFRLPNRNLA